MAQNSFWDEPSPIGAGGSLDEPNWALLIKNVKKKVKKIKRKKSWACGLSLTWLGSWAHKLKSWVDGLSRFGVTIVITSSKPIVAANFSRPIGEVFIVVANFLELMWHYAEWRCKCNSEWLGMAIIVSWKKPPAQDLYRGSHMGWTTCGVHPHMCAPVQALCK